MNSQEFDSLIKKDKYQVFIFTSLCSLPLFFAGHPWFVVNEKGIISRWEVLHIKNYSQENWGHLHKDFFPSWRGLEMLWGFSDFHWGSKLLSVLEGEENSLVAMMVKFIEKSPENYPYCAKYSFLGANSDTYVQWILDNFPELKIKLPWNCFGKNYKEK